MSLENVINKNRNVIKSTWNPLVRTRQLGVHSRRMEPNALISTCKWKQRGQHPIQQLPKQLKVQRQLPWNYYFEERSESSFLAHLAIGLWTDCDCPWVSMERSRSIGHNEPLCTSDTPQQRWTCPPDGCN